MTPEDAADIAQAMKEADLGIITIDAMIRRNGYTQDAQEAIAELRALLQQVGELALKDKEK